ncbi:MAG: sigma-70 family RNA polymerase sigma factor [Alphaproteobacteria bacterium]|nr:sigma-70 family RNA polymerase sigma factor [Alphaproteobacteria bacterium]
MKLDKNQQLTQLFISASQGDRAAYRQFLEATSHDLRRYLLRRVAASEVDDILQEILVSLHKARHTYDGKRPVMPWVYAIAGFRLADYLRQHYAKMRHKTVNIDVIPENIMGYVTEPIETNEYLSEAVEQLPERQQNILYLMHTEGYTAKEIAVQLGMGESAVKVAAHRAYKKIRKQMENSHD